jgi:hypothetical protein
MGRDKRIGTSEKVSTPPAMTTSACPEIIFSAPEQIAAFDEIHACGVFLSKTKGTAPAKINEYQFPFSS